jgi:hypothetical protein
LVPVAGGSAPRWLGGRYRLHYRPPLEPVVHCQLLIGLFEFKLNHLNMNLVV